MAQVRMAQAKKWNEWHTSIKGPYHEWHTNINGLNGTYHEWHNLINVTNGTTQKIFFIRGIQMADYHYWKFLFISRPVKPTGPIRTSPGSDMYF